MKLNSLDRTSSQNTSFTVKSNSHPNFLKVWHHHEELELVFIKKSTGTRFIGDSIEKFSEGEVILIGKQVPHLWLNDDVYFQENSGLWAEAIGIHFKEDFLGEKFLEIPEAKALSRLFLQSARGIKFREVDALVLKKIENLLVQVGFQKLIALFEVLDSLSKHKDVQLLCSEGYVNSFNTGADKSLDKFYSYIFKNFNKDICLKDVADVANMNPSAFSRFFKRVNRKTFTRYLNEIRIGYACKLLMEQNNTISWVCYEAGFNNISNFNRQFKTIVQMSPKEYIKLHS